MCGIFGSVGYDFYTPPKIQFIKKALNHRGPDDFGTFASGNENLFLAHTRLSIVDLSALGHQPMVDPDNGNVIVFNGEIYNFKDIRAELEDAGVIFTGSSDTEVILKGYGRYGVNVLNKLIGMFAFAIWDKNTCELFIARDRLGEKPLYFSQNKLGKFIFASELTALLVDSELNRSLNHQALIHFLRNGYTSTSASIISEIYKLDPAHYIIVSKGQVVKKIEYWKLNQFFLNKKNITEGSAIDELEDLLKNSLSQQLIADVPVGIFLSGGIDSGLIAGFSKNFKNPLSTFSAGFEELEFDERPAAAKIASYLNTQHTSFSLGNPSFEEILKPYKSCDEPFGDTSAIPTYYLAKLSRTKSKVCLTGDGGDELFGGYSTYLADKAYQASKFLPRSFFSCASFLTQYIPSAHGKIGLDYKLRAFFQASSSNFETAHSNWRQLFSKEEILQLLAMEFHEVVKEELNRTPNISSYWEDVKDGHFLDQSMYFDMKTWLVNDILFKADRMGMANSIELRAPFLDHRIVEFAASLPVDLKLRRWNSKYVLKEVANSKLGLNYKKDRKLGFNAPAAKWIKNYAGQIEDYLISSQLFNSNFIVQLLKQHIDYKRDNNHRIMALIGLVTWKYNVLENRA
jgi:asparagine synthase (glutamine-hydrolysing)